MTEPTLLIVDDDPGTCETLSDIFQEKGYTVATATTGREAQDKAKQTAFNVALIDIRLPDVDGTALLTEFKKTHPDMACMIITGHASVQNAINALEDGAEGYFVKPLIIEEIVHRVEKTVDKQRLVWEKRQAEEALWEERDKARKYLDVAEVMFVIIGANQKVTLANNKCCGILGYKEEEIIGKNWFDNFIPERIKDEVKTVFQKLMTGEIEAVEYFENPALTKSGEERIIAWHNTVLKDKADNIIGTLGSGEDITERKRVEEALRASEEKYRDLGELLPEVVFETDLEGNITYANQIAFDSFGYTQSDFDKGLNALQMLIPEDRDMGKENIQRVLSGQTIGSNEYTAQRRDKTTFPVIINSSSIIHENEPVGIRGVIIDITERKRDEEMLRESHERFKELNKTKTDFLNVAYHEMRSPLAPIVGYTSLLEQGELTEKQKKYVRVIGESASQLEELIESLLEVTRIEAGNVKLTLQTVLIPEIVDNVLERVKPQVEAKKQTISAVVPEGIEVEGDKQKITAIFDNLISNAIKYTGEKGRIDIVVEDRKEEEEIRVCVADTGVGIPREHLHRVFERFYMVDNSLTRKKGLGLGLAIVKGYAVLHGGKVWSTSEHGKGSKFWFTLPKRRN